MPNLVTLNESKIRHQSSLAGCQTCAGTEPRPEQVVEDGQAALRGDQQADPSTAPRHHDGREQTLPRPPLHLRVKVQHTLLHLATSIWLKHNTILNYDSRVVLPRQLPILRP